MTLRLRYLLGIFAFGSLVACMVPDVTKKADNPCGGGDCETDTHSAGSGDTSGNRSSSLQATTGAALPAGETKPAPVTQTAAANPDGGPTFTAPPASDSDAGTTDPVTADAPSCDKLLDCCVALRSAGKDTDADTCDNTWLQNDDLSCFLAQDGYANPTDGTTGACVQP